jgi:FtsH-binding integral membrane protein
MSTEKGGKKMKGSAQLEINAGASSRARRRRRFLRHFGEMLLVMLLGMGVLGGLAELAVAAAGGSLGDAPGSFRVLLMGVNMTVPMVAWMSYRGHPRAQNMEMAAAMMVPTLATAALAAAGALSTGAALGVQHAAMIPAMLGVMLLRYEHYS